MDRHLLLRLAYDGTGFHGWQRQPGQRTVQGVVEDVLRRVLRHPVDVRGASRTDAGVHARGQLATVRTSTPIPVERLAAAIGHHLPTDVALVAVRTVPEAFNLSLCARHKLYRYRVFHGARRPVEDLVQGHTWHVWVPLDEERLQAAARACEGTHDFAGFASAGAPRATTVRTVWRFRIQRVGSELHCDVEGDGFLYNQVRNMVGTLIEIGRGHWPVERVAEIFARRNRALAGPTAPAHGLCLQWIRCALPRECDDGTA